VVGRSRQVEGMVGRVGSFFVAGTDLRSASWRLQRTAIVSAGHGCQPLLKLLCRVADNSFVHKSAIILGLTLALSAATLAGIGEWAVDEAGNSAADPPSSSPSAAPPGEYAGSRVAVAAPLPMNLFPAGSYFPASTPGYSISRTVSEVRLEFTVADEQGRLVHDLAAKDIRILDNQVPVEHFSDFAREENLPLRLGIVLDTSDSVKRVLADEKAAALNFLNRIMRPQSDRAFVMGFGGDIRIWQTSTAERARLIGAVDRLHQPGWGTRFYDALYAACNGYLLHADDSGPVHRALVVLSDGDDTESFHDLRDVVAIALRGEVQIYALTLHGKKQVSRSDAVLQRLAEQTGGRFYVAQSSKDLEGMFAEIEQDLRTQYYVSFPPQQVTPGFHALQVQVRTPQKMQVHARQGYYALAQ
jgi:Ca-activated chloride channel family protein